MNRHYNNYNEPNGQDGYDRSFANINEWGDNTALEEGVGAFTAKVFAWMFFGLLVTAGAAFLFILGIMYNVEINRIASNKAFFISLIVAEFVAVSGISFGFNKISATTAKLLFVLYAGLNGVTLSYICLAYAGATVTKALLMTAVFFGIMAVYGYTTKANLAKVGPILVVGLISIIIATIINIFMKSPMMDYIICIAGLGIFAGLTAYDVQKIKKIYYQAVHQGGEIASKLSIFAALQLYLDFVNMFLYLLRLLGRKK